MDNVSRTLNMYNQIFLHNVYRYCVEIIASHQIHLPIFIYILSFVNKPLRMGHHVRDFQSSFIHIYEFMGEFHKHAGNLYVTAKQLHKQTIYRILCL